jgi:hypothetical protein
MIGLVVTGEKRTQDTHSVWPSGSPIVYLHSPMVFHSLIVLSREPDTICKQTMRQSSSCRLLCTPACMTAPSQGGVAMGLQWHGMYQRTCLLSMEKATERTSLLWPRNRRVVCPVCKSHKRRVPSQDPERANWPSEEITTSWTKCECPFNDFRAYP